MEKKESPTGLFIVSYEIGGNMPGAPLFKVNFSVYTPAKRVTGLGHITQAINPPLDIGTNLQGQYTYMCVMPDTCHILITATGYPIIKWPQHGGVGPVIPPNSDLRMVVGDDWKSGTANYHYLDSKGGWHEITDAPVKMIQGKPIVEG